MPNRDLGEEIREKALIAQGLENAKKALANSDYASAFEHLRPVLRVDSTNAQALAMQKRAEQLQETSQQQRRTRLILGIVAAVIGGSIVLYLLSIYVFPSAYLAFTGIYGPSRTPTFTSTPTYTFTPTFTFTPTYTPTLTDTPTFTQTPTYTYTPTFTFTFTPTLTPSITPTFSPTPLNLTIKFQVNIYENPSLDSRKAGFANPNDSVQILAIQGEWVHIIRQIGKVEGWVRLKDLNLPNGEVPNDFVTPTTATAIPIPTRVILSPTITPQQ